MAGGLGGRVDERTGQFGISMPLVATRGVGAEQVSMSLSWQQGRATASIDRMGWGAGWSLGVSFISSAGKVQVYPATGGSYEPQTSEPSGLKNYKMKDLVFKQWPSLQTLRDQGAGSASYLFTITYDDGHVDYFDLNGNLVARIDRFGNRTDVRWRPRGSGVWQPVSLTDTHGLSTTFDYNTPGQVRVISPERSDGIIPVTVIAVSGSGAVTSVTDPVGSKTTFSTSAVPGSPKPLVTGIAGASGARAVIGYQQPAYLPGLVGVDTLQVTDTAGRPLSPVQTFDFNPTLPAPDSNARHNYLGYPNHLPAGGQDTLFSSGDADYYYSTGLTTGHTTTISTYDAAHRLVKRSVSVVPAAGQLPITAQTHAFTYKKMPVVPPDQLPADYARATKISLTESAATSVDGLVRSNPRTTSVTASYDDHGRALSSTDESGVTTVTTYGPYGLILQRATTGADGAQATMVNTFTGSTSGSDVPSDLNVATSTTYAGPAGEDPTARSVTAYDYDDDGQPNSRTLRWAPGVDPEDGPGDGPDEITTTYARSVNTDGTLKLTTTVGAGTPDAQRSTATIDLASGKAVAHTDALGRTSRFGYDPIGRQITVTTPDGLTTSTVYAQNQTTVTGPNGRIQRTTTDVLGRTVSVTDNVRNQMFTSDPGARTLSSTSYSPDGGTATGTDLSGRQIVSTLDAFGRPVRRVGPTGLTHLTAYDDGAAHSSTTAIVPEGGGDSPAATTYSYDDAGRTTRTATTFADPAAPAARAGALALERPDDRVASAEFNGLGQSSTATDRDLRVVVDRSGPGAVSEESTVTPQATEEFPGAPITATTKRSLSGDALSRTLRQGDEVSTAVAVDYNAAGEVVAATDPMGRVTRYTFTADGQALTKTAPSGAVTTNTYDPTSGLLAKVTVTAPNKPTRTMSYTRVPAGKAGAGQIASVSDGTDTLRYSYDADGHRTAMTYPDGTTTTASYNDKQQLVTTTDVTGAVTTYGYDDESRMTTVAQKRGAAVLATVTFGYDAMDRVLTTRRGNGTVTTNTFTSDNKLAVQSTTDPANKVLESHAYTYDSHGNVITRTDTLPAGGSAAVPGGGDTWSTAYGYDAYDRLISSAVYPGSLSNGAPTAPAATTSRYTVDLGGDVTAVKTTNRVAGTRPVITTTSLTNTIDDSGRLTAQQTGSKAPVPQTFDADGRVTTSLTGLTTEYTADGAPATATAADGSTTTYTRWPDGSVRSATYRATDGTTRSVVHHYGTDGTLANDSTADSASPAGQAVTASYLTPSGREARTLLPGTAPSGQVTGTASAPVLTGSGTGYYLRDRHNSVTSMLDSSRTATATYGYTDYGAPARADGRVAGTSSFDGGRTNPFRYLGASVHGPLTDSATGLLRYDVRSYNPTTGRFTSPDPIDTHNRYQGFRTNPISFADLGGQISSWDMAMDTLFAVVFLATALFTFGASVVPMAGVLMATTMADLTIGIVANVAATGVALLANVAGAVTSAALAADDGSILFAGKSIFADGTKDRAKWTMANTFSSVLAGAAGVLQGATAGSFEALKAVTTARTEAAEAAEKLATDTAIAANDAALTDEDFLNVRPRLTIPLPATPPAPPPAVQVVVPAEVVAEDVGGAAAVVGEPAEGANPIVGDHNGPPVELQQNPAGDPVNQAPPPEPLQEQPAFRADDAELPQTHPNGNDAAIQTNQQVSTVHQIEEQVNQRLEAAPVTAVTNVTQADPVTLNRVQPVPVGDEPNLAVYPNANVLDPVKN